MPFTGVADLLESVDLRTLDLPAPQRHAVEVALRRAEPGDEAIERLAISVGFLNVLRSLVRAAPMVVAVDDLHWLDRASADVVLFAARRAPSATRFLLARRSDGVDSLERALEARGLARIEVGPLSLGASRALLAQRLGQSLSRRLVRRIVERSDGNPLLMIEFGRLVVENGLDDVDLAVDGAPSIDRAFDERVGSLEGGARRVLLAIALAGELPREQLAALCDEDEIDEAVDAGLLRVDADRVRAAHPLISVAARSVSGTRERRHLHRELALHATDSVLRARHLACATTEPADDIAEALFAAASAASLRGAPEDAVELAEHGLRLTPTASISRAGRLITLGQYLDATGEQARIAELLEGRLAELPSGPLRAHAHLLLGETADTAAHERHLESALEESANDPHLRAIVFEKRAILLAGVRFERLAEADAMLENALPLASGDANIEHEVLHSLAWTRTLRGMPTDELMDRLRACARGTRDREAVDHLRAQQLLWRGEVDRARPVFRRLAQLAGERGDARYVRLHFQLCGLELRAGDTHAAQRFLGEADEWLTAGGAGHAGRARFQAMLAAVRGRSDEARALAETTVLFGEDVAMSWHRLEGLRALGVGALLQGEASDAAAALRAVWAHIVREGIHNPGVIPVGPDLVEALAELGEVEEARSIVERLHRQATAQRHPWGLTAAAHSHALLALSQRHDADAMNALIRSAAEYDRLGLRFDRARTLLSCGRAARRSKKWATARQTLTQAAEVFAAIGGEGWVAAAEAELSRLGGRKPRASGELTPAEWRIVELVADGLTNKQIAIRLHVTVGTVETHLKHIYGKLGVRSRVQLVRRLADDRSPALGP